MSSGTTLKERIDALGAAGVHVPAATGLAFWSLLLFWVAVIPGRGAVSRMLHPWRAHFFCGGNGIVRDVAPQMRHTDRDQSGGSGPLLQPNQDDKMPPAGRYNAGQSFCSGDFWSAVALLRLAYVLWFPERIRGIFALRYISVLVHPRRRSSRLLFLIHIYMACSRSAGIWFGHPRRCSIEFAKRYHPGWTKRLSAGPPRRANEDDTDRWDRVRRANAARRALIL